MPRMPLSIAAALALHLLVLGSGRIGAQAVPPPAAAGALTVRLIEPPARAVAAEQAPVQERSSRAAVANEAAGAIPAGATGAAPATEAGPAVASTAARPEVRPPRTRTPGPSAAASAPADLVAAATPSLAPERPAAALPDVAPALPPAPAYLLGARLDPGPMPIGEIEPAYPESANLQEGKVVVRVLISDAGTVDNVAVVRSAPPGLFEEAALEAFGKARFSPGRVAGMPVKSQITVEVHFLPINRGSRISGRGY